MKTRMKQLGAILLAGVLVSGLTACGNSGSTTGTDAGSTKNETTAEASSDTSIGIVVKTATNAHFQDIAYGAMLAGKELGVEVRVDNTSTEADVDGQITKCENMISAGVDALILTANDSDGVSTAVDAAHEANIPFVTVDTEITNVWGEDVSEYLPNYIGVNHTEMAYRLACQVFDQMGGQGNVVVLRGVDAASSSRERTEGFEKAIAEYEGITELDSQSANYDQDTATTTMADILQAHPDVDAVLCCNDLMAVGAVTALEENNLNVGVDGVLVAGIDGNYIALQSIEEGKVYASAYDWSILQGYYAVQQAYALINGEEVPELTYTPDVVITSDNVADYIQHGEELAGWTMGEAIAEVSDYMNGFVAMGQEMTE